MKAKVCFVSLRSYAVFQPGIEELFGGAEVQVYLLSRALSEDPDYEVVCVSRDYGQPDGEVINGVNQRKIFQGTGLLRRITPVKNLLSAWGLYRTLKSIDADLYIQRCAGVETGIVALYSRFKRKKWFFSAASDGDVDGGFEKTIPTWLKKLFRYGIDNADVLICQNQYQKQNLFKRFSRNAHIVPSLCEVPQSYSEPGGNNVLWVGRCIPDKGPEQFIEVARALPQHEFLMLMNEGPDPEYSSRVFETTRAVDNLRLVQGVPYHDVEKYFRDARVLVSTAVREGFPNTFLQAMKYGVPILSLFVNPNEIMTRENVGLVAEGDLARLKDGLARLFVDNVLFRELSLNAYRYVSRHHDINRETDLYKRIIQTALT